MVTMRMVIGMMVLVMVLMMVVLVPVVVLRVVVMRVVVTKAVIVVMVVVLMVVIMMNMIISMTVEEILEVVNVGVRIKTFKYLYTNNYSQKKVVSIDARVIIPNSMQKRMAICHA